MKKPHFCVDLTTRSLLTASLLIGTSSPIGLAPESAYAQGTARGVLQGRPGPALRRRCEDGANAGSLCKEAGDCPGGTCPDRNIFNFSTSVRFNATAAQLTRIENMWVAAAAALFDATDGQAQIGQVSIFNDTSGDFGDLWVQEGNCGYRADTGLWANNGHIYSCIDRIQNDTAAEAGETLAHEIVHLVFDARDEYETRIHPVTGARVCAGDPTGCCDRCPELGAAGERCLMDQGGLPPVSTELCWGAGDPGDFADVSGGNHDADRTTEQSICRANRSCWEQVGWSWPNTFLVPAGAPDPGANGLVVDPVVFLRPPANARIVLVVDRSGSMGTESPTRLSRLQTAALDFVNLVQNGTELAIVSFSTTANVEVGMTTVAADRADFRDAISGLSASGATNIADGLVKARLEINNAGGATAQTSVVLMTDGVNNQGNPTPQAALQAALNDLANDNVPVRVTCTGGDAGLSSQCSEIAAATGGTFADSASAADLAENFTNFHESIIAHDPVASLEGSWTGTERQYDVLIEPNATSAAFVLLSEGTPPTPALRVKRPNGTFLTGIQTMPQGQFVRELAPQPGTWTVFISPFTPPCGQSPAPQCNGTCGPGDFCIHSDGTCVCVEIPVLRTGDALATDLAGAPRTTVAFPFVSRAYVQNPAIGTSGSRLIGPIQPGQAMRLCAVPIYRVPLAGVSISGSARLPGGSSFALALLDNGLPPDDAFGDGIYCGAVPGSLTSVRGSYNFKFNVNASNATEDNDGDGNEPPQAIPPFQRELLLTGVVNDVDDPNIPGADPALDHFNCSRAKGASAEVELELTDQFEAKRAGVSDPKLLCNAASKNEERIFDPAAHLGCYKIKQARGQGKFVKLRAEVQNQLGSTVVEVKKPKMLCAPTDADHQPTLGGLDHFKCYKVKSEAKFAKIEGVRVRDTRQDAVATILKPSLLCNPAQKNGGGILNPEDHLLCYRTKAKVRVRRTEVRVTNQFVVDDAWRVSKGRTLCVPSKKTAL